MAATKTISAASILGLMLALSGVAKAQVPFKDGEWPQWRGPNRDGISLDKNLLKEWPTDGPPVEWQVDTVGVGYSSIAIKDGRIFTQGDIDGVERFMALDLKDGHLLWSVQPAGVGELLDVRITNEMKQLDKDKDSKVSETEALARFGWEWTKFDKPGKETAQAVAARRSAALIKELDKDNDGKLSFAEAGNLFRDTFDRLDAADPKADAPKLAASRAAEYIKQLDKDGDGKISKAEAKNTALDRHFGRIDQQDPETKKGDEQLTLAELTAAFEKHEAGRDGIVTREELEKYYVDNKILGDGLLSADELRTAIGGYRNGMGDGPRGTPTVDADRVYVEGGNGDVACLEAKTGKTIWLVNLRDLGGGVPGWGYSESPLVVDNYLIVTPGGKSGTLAALDKMTGKLVWQSKDVTEGAHYSTPVVADIGGVRQIVQFANQSVFGVTLADGKPMWRYAAPANGTANCCSPIVVDNQVFASSSYGTGGGLAKIVPSGSLQLAEEVYFEKKMACHHGGIVKVGNYMYSSGAGAVICMAFDSGEIKWQARGAGKGAIVVADNMLYQLGEGHEVALAEVNPEGYKEHGKFKIKDHGKPAWAHPVVSGGRFYIRDQESLTAYDVRAK